MPEAITFTCSLEERFAGWRADRAAAAVLPEYSRGRLQAWMKEGCLTLDGSPVRPSQRVTGGELLRLDAELPDETEVLPQDMPLEVLASDPHFLVLDKPAGLVVHPAAGNRDGTLLNALLHHDPALAAIPRGGIVHRLDKDTTGVMVVARSLQAHASLVRQLQARSMRRVYEAVVCGAAPGDGTVDAPIGRNPRDRQRMAVVPSGRRAVSHYRVLRRFPHFSRLEVSLETGRTHQIRVHMQHVGMPLVGDPLYGRRTARRHDLPAAAREAIGRFPRQALHARTLSFEHPETGRAVSFEAPLPGDMAALLDTLDRVDTGSDA